jgi:hypothetical protein
LEGLVEGADFWGVEGADFSGDAFPSDGSDFVRHDPGGLAQAMATGT